MYKKYSNLSSQSNLAPAENGNENNQFISEISTIDPQVKTVKAKIIRRKFSASDKLKIIEAFEACSGALERGAFLRKEGLYYASISKWKKELSEKKSNHTNTKAYKLTLAHNQLLRENEKLKKKLSQAEAIIEIQKKVSKLLSDHVLDQELSEVQS
jgi:hypothetical protein